MLRRVVAELLAVAEFWHRLAVHTSSRLGGLDDGGHIVGVAVDRRAALQDRERDTLGFEITLVSAKKGRELSAGGVSHYEHPPQIPAMLRDVRMYPAQRPCDVANYRAHVDVRQQSVVRGYKHETGLGEGGGLLLDGGLVARLPAPAVNPEYNRQVL